MINLQYLKDKLEPKGFVLETAGEIPIWIDAVVKTDRSKLIHYLNSLQDNKQLPVESKDHSLSGEYQDCREFHLGGDMLLIYLEKLPEKEIVLLRIGTHSQLFK